MNDNLRCMRRGKELAPLSLDDALLVGGFSHRGAKKQRAILLLHGFSSSPAVFRRLIPHLINYDAVVAPLLPGHGKDLVNFSETKASDWLAAVDQQCEALCQEYKTVDVLGLSLGGVLACHLSQYFPLHHLYLLAPALKLRLNLAWNLILARFFYVLGFRRIRAYAGDLYTNNYCEIAYRQLPLSIIIELLSLIRNFNFCAPTCPTDVFLGAYDKVVDSEQVASVFTGLESIKIHRLANSAHILPLDGDLDVIIDCIKKNQ